MVGKSEGLRNTRDAGIWSRPGRRRQERAKVSQRIQIDEGKIQAQLGEKEAASVTALQD
jgi:hypothetical protein